MYFHCSNSFQNNIRQSFITSIYFLFLFSYHNYNLISHNLRTTVQVSIARWKTCPSWRISRKACLGQSIGTWLFFSKRDFIHKFITIMINKLQQNWSKTCYFLHYNEIAISKNWQKHKNKRLKEFHQLHFLKSCCK